VHPCALWRLLGVGLGKCAKIAVRQRRGIDHGIGVPFGAAFGPALLMCLFWRRVTERGVLAGIVTGGITVLIWKQAALLGLYEIVPGFLLAFLAIYTVSKMDAEPPAKVTELFDRVNRSG